MRPIDPARLSLDDEHPQLAGVVRRALELLSRLRQELVPVEGQSAWMQHGEFADRAWHLADHLASALADADATRYASALGTLRTALEHQLIDRLLLHAERYYDVIEPLSREDFAALEAECASLPDVVAVEQWGNGARLTRAGHNVVDDRGTVVERISPYWRVLQEHDATVGPPKIQQEFADGIFDVPALEEHAQRNATLYSRYLRWEAILRNLVLNGLCEQVHVQQFEVHYRWLSAFSHATKTGYDIIERECGHPSWGVRRRSHLLGELALLYAAVTSADEMRAFMSFVDERSQLVRLSNRAELEALAVELEGLTAYFWWPGAAPSYFDRVREANRRVWMARQADESAGWPAAPDPTSLSDEEVGYYPDPHERLKQMHEPFVEGTTGLSYQPPW